MNSFHVDLVGAVACVALLFGSDQLLSVIPNDVHGFFPQNFHRSSGTPLPHSMINVRKKLCSFDFRLKILFLCFVPVPQASFYGGKWCVPVALSMEARGRSRKQKKRACSLTITVRSVGEALHAPAPPAVSDPGDQAFREEQFLLGEESDYRLHVGR